MTIVRVKIDLVKKRRWLSLGFETKVCGGKERDVRFGEFGEGCIGVVSKIGEIGGDVGGEMFGDRGGE
ncbi:hypothetical protein Tco_1152437 [Tanacetum coccineum]